MTDSWIKGGDWSGPFETPPDGISPAPLAGAPLPRHTVSQDRATFEWSGGLGLTTKIVIDGEPTTVGDFLAAHDGAVLSVVDAIESAARADVLAAGGTNFTCLADFGSTLAQRLAARFGWLDGQMVLLPRLDDYVHRSGDGPGPAFEAAREALLEADLYPMTSIQCRRAVQRAYQLLTQATTETDDRNEWTHYQNLARGLVEFLSVDWTQVELVEVRYADGTTETLHIGGDPAATEQIRGAVAFRVVPTLD
ncbi:hypothetical protein [Cellulomonas sp. Leaf395]|uniref:hypothetical protein n=1 Tax=Cellulomonas sp. Leaf395 TaxID=1736362 RepID=UPI0012F7493B|nr:hypothetical protein [Cellulomonas sp. Leaf395]